MPEPAPARLRDFAGQLAAVRADARAAADHTREAWAVSLRLVEARRNFRERCEAVLAGFDRLDGPRPGGR